MLKRILLGLALTAFLLLTGCEPEVRYIVNTQTVTTTSVFTPPAITLTVTKTETTMVVLDLSLNWIETISGANGETQSQPFTLKNRGLVMDWYYSPFLTGNPSLRIQIYKVGTGFIKELYFSGDENIEGTTYLHFEPGDYYLIVVGNNVWDWLIDINGFE